MSYNLSIEWLDPIKMAGWFLGVCGGIITLIWAISNIKPRVKNSTLVMRYIDYAENLLIEEKEYELSWGRILWGRMFPQKVKLPKLSRDSTFQLLYKPLISYKQMLPKDQYVVVEKGSTRAITLIDKRFFEEAETIRVNVVTMTSIKDEDYKKKINSTYQKDAVVITNENLEEIRNYPLSFLSNIDIANLAGIFPFLSMFNPAEEKYVVREIAAMKGNTPGRLIIPLREA